MKAWEQMYDSEILAEGKAMAENVKIIENDGGRIVAEIEGFEVETYIEYNSPYYGSCNCSRTLPCKHEAALTYYLIDHPELYLKELTFDEIFEDIDEKSLREFLFREFQSNDKLKSKFLKEFKANPINKEYYRDKLTNVFKSGEGRDFKHFEVYDLDMMEDSLYDFIFHDISTILSAGEYDFACELLCRIAELLNDELMVSYDSWHNLADRFMEHVNTLSASIYLDAQKMDELYSRMDFMLEII